MLRSVPYPAKWMTNAGSTWFRTYFDLRDATDGITPETGEAGGQPEHSVTGGAWANTYMTTLSHIGNGRYYADFDNDFHLNLTLEPGSMILTRYKSSATVETPGSSFFIDGGSMYGVSLFGKAITGTTTTQIKCTITSSTVTPLGVSSLFDRMLVVALNGNNTGVNRKITSHTFSSSYHYLNFSGSSGAADAAWPYAFANNEQFLIIGRMG